LVGVFLNQNEAIERPIHWVACIVTLFGKEWYFQ